MNILNSKLFLLFITILLPLILLAISAVYVNNFIVWLVLILWIGLGLAVVYLPEETKE